MVRAVKAHEYLASSEEEEFVFIAAEQVCFV